MIRLTMFLVLVLAISSRSRGEDLPILCYDLVSRRGDVVCDYCFDLQSGIHCYEWHETDRGPAHLAVFDGREFWMVRYYERTQHVSEIGVFSDERQLGKPSKLVRSDVPNDEGFSGRSSAFYSYAPLDRLQKLLGVDKGNLQVFSTEILSPALPTLRRGRPETVDLSPRLRSEHPTWKFVVDVGEDGFPSTMRFKDSRSVAAWRPPDYPELAYRRATTRIDRWDLESRINLDYWRRRAVREYRGEEGE